MPVLQYDDINVTIDEEGYLLNMDEWNEKVARALAEREGVEELTEERMDIIKFLRDYYIRYNYFPILNAVCLNVHQAKACVKEQFIHPLKAWKIAGLPKPPDVVLTYLNYGQVPT
jgi:TusE/DsrC/DsvC family sulfur relay protein